MNTLMKSRIKSVLKYTWPFYIVSALVLSFGLYFIFNATHQIPGYKTLTIFISGESTDYKKLENDVLNKFKDNELKSFSTVEVDPDDPTYNTQLNLPGIGSSDILIIPLSKLETINLKNFALDLDNELINTYYTGLSFYERESIKYGIKIDKDKVKEYMRFTSEDHYMFLNFKSENLGEYGTNPNKAHDNALNLVKDWGK